MNSSIYRFTLDLHSAQSQISIPVLLGDTGRALHISLSDGGNPYIIANGSLARLSVRRPSGTKFEEFCSIENNTTIVYPFDQNKNTAAVEGMHDCDITLYGADGRRIGSPRFSMMVSERVIPYDDIVITDEDKNFIEALMESVVEAEAGRVNAEAQRQINEGVRQDTLGRLDAALQQVDDKITEIERMVNDGDFNGADGSIADYRISTTFDKAKLTVALKDSNGNVVNSDSVDGLVSEAVVDEKIAAAITTTLNTEVKG